MSKLEALFTFTATALILILLGIFYENGATNAESLCATQGGIAVETVDGKLVCLDRKAVLNER